MCGIFATFGYNDTDISLPFNLIKHRGPDDTRIEKVGAIGDNNIVFGFHRLAVIDLSEESSQPLRLDDLYLICNGEIFNYLKLADIYGFDMNTKSDCEIILHLYKEFRSDVGSGEKALISLLSVIRGEFAFVLYDKANNTLMAARDTFGVRPLFYTLDGANMAFASELKALPFAKNVKPFVPGTFYYTEQTQNNVKILFRSYTALIPTKNVRSDLRHTHDAQKIHKTIRFLLEDAVKIRLQSIRPVGCFLSGGVDSSLITAIVAKHIPNLNCFSIGLKGGADIAFAKMVVKHINESQTDKSYRVTHHIVEFTVADGIQALSDVIYHLETYDITTIRASIPQFLLSKFIAMNTDIKVLYSGEGADEVFNSYLYSRLAPSAKALEDDSKRLLSELYMFDNLRVDRTTAAFGLEVRIPFLDPRLSEYLFCLDPALRLCNKDIEKKLLRDSFAGTNLLPDEILYRKKEAFSDAVSSESCSWYKSLANHIDYTISDEEFNTNKTKYRLNPPPTKEAYYYRKVFDDLFPDRASVLKHYWMPKWTNTNGDPSATVLNCYT